MAKRISIRATLGTLAVAIVAIQFVPYGRDHVNPEPSARPAWDSDRTEALARRACFDCHSNETRWPAYASIAPVSWIVQHDVEEARSKLNFSEFDREQRRADDAAVEVEEGDMPLKGYLLLHPDARLDEAQRQELVRGLKATFGGADEDEDEDEEH